MITEVTMESMQSMKNNLLGFSLGSFVCGMLIQLYLMRFKPQDRKDTYKYFSYTCFAFTTLLLCWYGTITDTIRGILYLVVMFISLIFFMFFLSMALFTSDLKIKFPEN